MTTPPQSKTDDFYVGYRPVSRAQRFFNIGAIALFLIGALTLGAALTINQSDPGDGVWDTAAQTKHQGVLLANPAPMIVTTREDGAPFPVLLVDYNKFGADSRVEPLDTRPGVVRGSRIARFGVEMIELDPTDAGVEALDNAATPKPLRWTDAGEATIQGEIIDPKCYLGAMKPGRGKVHKACAIRCISGGIPPMLLAAHPGGAPRFILLHSSDPSALRDLVIPHVADPVEVRGRLRQSPEAPFETLEIRPGDIAPL